MEVVLQEEFRGSTKYLWGQDVTEITVCATQEHAIVTATKRQRGGESYQRRLHRS